MDVLHWQRGLGATGPAATRAAGNADNDNDVDSDDLAVWRSQFGSAVALVAASPALVGASLPSDRQLALTPQAVDVAMAWQQMQAEPFLRPMFRTRRRSR